MTSLCVCVHVCWGLLITTGKGGSSGSPHGLRWHRRKVALLLLSSGKNLDSPLDLLSPPLSRKLPSGSGVQAVLMVSTDTTGTACYRLAGMRVPALFSAFYDTTPEMVVVVVVTGLRHLVAASPGWKSGLPTQPWLVWVGLGPQFSLRCLAGVEWLLSKSVQRCWTAPFLFLWLECACFFCLYLVFLGCQHLELQVWDI